MLSFILILLDVALICCTIQASKKFKQNKRGERYMINKMHMVASLFGLKLYEEFLLDGKKQERFRFTTNGVEYRDITSTRWYISNSSFLIDICKGIYTVEKAGHKPHYKEN